MEKWHIWFAWYPVLIENEFNSGHKLVWWKNVLRRLDDNYFNNRYEYKEIK